MKIVSRPSVVVVRRPSSSSSVMSCVRLSSVPASSSSSVCPSRPSVVVRSKINCFYKQNVILDQQMLIFHWFYKVVSHLWVCILPYSRWSKSMYFHRKSFVLGYIRWSKIDAPKSQILIKPLKYQQFHLPKGTQITKQTKKIKNENN